MNIFYVSPEQVFGDHLELRDQEARHASKVLRYSEGDPITAVDGMGGWYEGVISTISKDSVSVQIKENRLVEKSAPELVLGMGILKKRDRLEFAVEKAVELGVNKIMLFRGRHTVKENIRKDRLEMTAISAMKQSLRAWLPEILVADSLEKVIGTFPDHLAVIATMGASSSVFDLINSRHASSDKLLLVGSEGGFSDRELQAVSDKQVVTVSLGEYRLRSETAAIVMVNALRKF